MIKEILNSRFEEHHSSGKFPISSINGCWRRKYLEMKGLWKETYDSKALRTFSIGELFHKQAVKEIMEKGEQFGLYVVAAEVNIPQQKYISGRADLIISISSTGELIVCDIKSSSDWTLNKAKEGECAENYIHQVQLYLHFFKLKRGYILFFGKHKGEIEEVEVLYDKELCEKLIKEVEDFFINYVDKNVEPPPCSGGLFGCACCGTKGEFEKNGK